jgi:osmotically-inducible protein OsmY
MQQQSSNDADRQDGVKNMKRIMMVAVAFLISTSFATLVMSQDKAAAAAEKAKQESTGEYIDDSVITNKVKALLAKDDFLKSFRISVVTFKGNGQLSGFVDSQKAVDTAGEIASSVKWVKSVKNSLVVK